MINRASGDKVRVNSVPRASLREPCHQDVRRRRVMGHRRPSVVISPQGYMEKMDICWPGVHGSVVVRRTGMKRP